MPTGKVRCPSQVREYWQALNCRWSTKRVAPCEREQEGAHDVIQARKKATFAERRGTDVRTGKAAVPFVVQRRPFRSPVPFRSCNHWSFPSPSSSLLLSSEKHDDSVVMVGGRSGRHGAAAATLIFVFFLLMNILGFGCNLQYFRRVYLFPKSLSCNGYYVAVGEIKSDVLPR